MGSCIASENPSFPVFLLCLFPEKRGKAFSAFTVFDTTTYRAGDDEGKKDDDEAFGDESVTQESRLHDAKPDLIR
jgi:hypothetical protein